MIYRLKQNFERTRFWFISHIRSGTIESWKFVMALFQGFSHRQFLKFNMFTLRSAKSFFSFYNNVRTVASLAKRIKAGFQNLIGAVWEAGRDLIYSWGLGILATSDDKSRFPRIFWHFQAFQIQGKHWKNKLKHSKCALDGDPSWCKPAWYYLHKYVLTLIIHCTTIMVKLKILCCYIGSIVLTKFQTILKGLCPLETHQGSAPWPRWVLSSKPLLM